ncbi:MAG: response regulator [Chloroflexi bacterium]|nr:response regulator [Chloroflexota bacterium]MCH7655620.1 response regulator [Chloroflexota bacterium]
MAEDDPEDAMLAADALHEAKLLNPFVVVEDGRALMDYLHRTGAFAPPHPAVRPGIILLDLNMPRMNGKEALAEIRSDPGLRDIPVVVLTTSRADEDVLRSYTLGANSFIVKPVSFEGLVDVMRGIESYWFEMVRLPAHGGAT